jgi:ubiquinone/menaquinone biosynthesis C-methylase UbiE
MALVMDPAGAEISALRKLIHWHGKQVLEVGCGNGRLTLHLAGLGAQKIVAFDPDSKLIRAARRNLPDQYKECILYRVGNAEKMRLKANQFDVVVFSWVL